MPFLWLAPAFIKAFTSDVQIIEVGVAFLRAYAWVVPFMAIQMSMMCTFQATGDALRAMMVNLGRQCLFNILFLYLFNRLWGLEYFIIVNLENGFLALPCNSIDRYCDVPPQCLNPLPYLIRTGSTQYIQQIASIGGVLVPLLDLESLKL